MCLPTPDDAFFKEFKSLICHFLWGKRTAQIAYDKIEQDLLQGGLKLIDLQSKDWYRTHSVSNFLLLEQN